MMTAALFGKVGFIITIGKNSSFFEKKTDNNVWEYKKRVSYLKFVNVMQWEGRCLLTYRMNTGADLYWIGAFYLSKTVVFLCDSCHGIMDDAFESVCLQGSDPLYRRSARRAYLIDQSHGMLIGRQYHFCATQHGAGGNFERHLFWHPFTDCRTGKRVDIEVSECR